MLRAPSDEGPSLDALLAQGFVQLVGEARSDLGAVGEVRDPSLQRLGKQLRIRDLEIRRRGQPLRQLPVGLRGVGAARHILRVCGDEVFEVLDGLLAERRRGSLRDVQAQGRPRGRLDLAAGPRADDVHEQPVGPEHSLLHPGLRGPNISPLALMEDCQVALFEICVHVQNVLEHIGPTPRREGLLEGSLRGLLGVRHLMQDLTPHVSCKLRHLVVQPMHQGPVVQRREVRGALHVALVGLHDEQEVLLDEGLLRQQVLHGAPLLVLLHSYQRLHARDAQGDMQGVQHLRPLEAHGSVGDEASLHVVEDGASDVS
mmetsp:Transcript_7065/g.19989  ORF Transcript_7065/g.19989 Transcript_7065/m.19989 type:complete len:315 (+) Transcript_7065:570-1514(+)